MPVVALALCQHLEPEPGRHLRHQEALEAAIAATATSGQPLPYPIVTASTVAAADVGSILAGLASFELVHPGSRAAGLGPCPLDPYLPLHTHRPSLEQFQVSVSA